MRAPFPEDFTTQGRAHWYVVCAQDEQRASLVGPFFAEEDAAEEVAITNRQLEASVPGTCDLPHFVTRGPMPMDDGRFVFGVRRPTLYQDDEGHDWWQAWAYSGVGELGQAKHAVLERERCGSAVAR